MKHFHFTYLHQGDLYVMGAGDWSELQDRNAQPVNFIEAASNISKVCQAHPYWDSIRVYLVIGDRLKDVTDIVARDAAKVMTDRPDSAWLAAYWVAIDPEERHEANDFDDIDD